MRRNNVIITCDVCLHTISSVDKGNNIVLVEESRNANGGMSTYPFKFEDVCQPCAKKLLEAITKIRNNEE